MSASVSPVGKDPEADTKQQSKQLVVNLQLFADNPNQFSTSGGKQDDSQYEWITSRQGITQLKQWFIKAAGGSYNHSNSLDNAVCVSEQTLVNTLHKITNLSDYQILDIIDVFGEPCACWFAFLFFEPSVRLSHISLFSASLSLPDVKQSGSLPWTAFSLLVTLLAAGQCGQCSAFL